MTDALPLTGGCGCGAVRFEISEPLQHAGYCHCTRCQHRSGASGSPQGRVVPGSFRLVSGAEVLGTWAPPGGSLKVFCTGCGCALYSQSPDDPEIVNPRLGAFDGDPGIRPQYHQFAAYAPVWEALPEDGLPRYPERRPQ
jgi:hypothetical protein